MIFKKKRGNGYLFYIRDFRSLLFEKKNVGFKRECINTVHPSDLDIVQAAVPSGTASPRP